jgi:hypothetical protein
VLDDFKRSQISAMVAGGCSLRDAAHYIRCSYKTIRREMKWDPEFKAQLGRSELYAQLSPLRSMQQAVSTHWRAAAWFLERAYPERFGRRSTAALGPRQARELCDEVRCIIKDEVPDPLLSIRIENRIRSAFRCFIRATGQNARNCRDLREVLRAFEEKDGLNAFIPKFDFLSPRSSPIRSRPPSKAPASDNAAEKKRADAPDSDDAAHEANLRILEGFAKKMHEAALYAKRKKEQSGADSPAATEQSASPTPTPVGKTP